MYSHAIAIKGVYYAPNTLLQGIMLKQTSHTSMLTFGSYNFSHPTQYSDYKEVHDPDLGVGPATLGKIDLH